MVTRLPIRKGLLKLLVQTIEQSLFANQPYLALLYKTIKVTAYFRIGDLTSGPHAVKAKDVRISKNKNKLMFILRTLKTHWNSDQPQIIKINSSEFNPMRVRSNEETEIDTICPFKIRKQYLIHKKMMKSCFLFSEITARLHKTTLGRSCAKH